MKFHFPRPSRRNPQMADASVTKPIAKMTMTPTPRRLPRLNSIVIPTPRTASATGMPATVITLTR